MDVIRNGSPEFKLLNNNISLVNTNKDTDSESTFDSSVT